MRKFVEGELVINRFEYGDNQRAEVLMTVEEANKDNPNKYWVAHFPYDGKGRYMASADTLESTGYKAVPIVL